MSVLDMCMEMELDAQAKRIRELEQMMHQFEVLGLVHTHWNAGNRHEEYHFTEKAIRLITHRAARGIRKIRGAK